VDYISREDRSYSILIIIIIIIIYETEYLPYRAFKPLLTPRQLYIKVQVYGVTLYIILETLLRMYNNY